jgi:tRNA (guanine26-N2/guanine27-N2)-dimethyltransferase
MAGDRDLAVAFATAWSSRAGTGQAGWEVAAATGVRGLRLLNESGAFDHFLLTEANAEAAGVLAQNARRYPGALAVLTDARLPPSAASFGYVDIDPYGTPAPFVAAALAALRPDGVLAVTATDMMVLAGVQQGACERRYGSRPVRGRLGPEGGLRILLAFLAREARARGRAIRPLLSYTRDHHVRAYVQVLPVTEGMSADPVRTIDPVTWSGPFLGDHGPYGPLWLGPLFDPPIVSALRVPPHAARAVETERFIARLQEEVHADQPFYYESNRLAGDLRLPTPPALASLLDTLRARGFHAARTHARPEGFRTDASRGEVEATARALDGSR